jgi:hypothetical protein
MSGSEQQIAGEVEAACRRYYADYPAALWRNLTEGAAIDYDALACWTFPMLLIIGTPQGAIVTISDQAIYDSQVRGAYDQYYANGWAGRLNLDHVRVSVASPTAALVEVRGTRFRADGSDLNHWDACYLFQRTAAGWRQHAVIDTEPPRPPASEWVRWLATAPAITRG